MSLHTCADPNVLAGSHLHFNRLMVSWYMKPCYRNRNMLQKVVVGDVFGTFLF